MACSHSSVTNNQPVFSSIKGLLHSITYRVFNANSIFCNNSLKTPNIFYCNDICFITDARINKGNYFLFNKSVLDRTFVSFSHDDNPIHGTALIFPEG